MFEGMQNNPRDIGYRFLLSFFYATLLLVQIEFLKDVLVPMNADKEDQLLQSYEMQVHGLRIAPSPRMKEVKDIFFMANSDSEKDGSNEKMLQSSSIYGVLQNQVPKYSDEADTMITNDIPWKDNRTNEILETNKGGKITKLNNKFYWVGSIPEYLLIYESSGLGNNSWTMVKKFPHGVQNGNPDLGECQLKQHPVNKMHYIFCKGRRWFKQSINDEGNIENMSQSNASTNSRHVDPTIGTYELLPKPEDPSSLPQLSFVSHSVYLENDKLYFIVSRIQHHEPSSRTIYIYKLNDQWTDFEPSNESGDNYGSAVTTFKWNSREAPWLFKRKGLYYLVASQTRGWQQSKTFYLMSTSMEGLRDSEEKEVIMHPQNNAHVKSMGSQFRFMMQPDYNDGDERNGEEETERWIFGGERYPVKGPEFWDSQYGKWVMVPMNFINDVPHVYWKEHFNWEAYDYKSGDYDNQKHKYSGYGPPTASLYSAADGRTSFE